MLILLGLYVPDIVHELLRQSLHLPIEVNVLLDVLRVHIDVPQLLGRLRQHVQRIAVRSSTRYIGQYGLVAIIDDLLDQVRILAFKDVALSLLEGLADLALGSEEVLFQLFQLAHFLL